MITKRIDIFTLLDVISDYFAVSKEKRINNLLMYEDVRETVECINYLIGERVGTIEPPKRIQQNGFWYILEEKQLLNN